MLSTVHSVYVSGYTNEQSLGIYQYDFKSSTGVLTPKGLAMQTVNPSFFTIDKNTQHLYAVNEGRRVQRQQNWLCFGLFSR